MNQLKGTPNGSLFAATLGFAAGFAAVALFGPTASRFQEVMHLSPIMVGFLVSAPALSGSLLRIPFSAWVDTTGGRKPFLVLLTLSLVGMAGLLAVISALYPDHLSRNLYPLLLLLGVLCGCGIATFSVGISQVSYWFPQAKQGRALAVYGGVGNLAPGVFSFLLPVALASMGLAKSYAAWFVFLLAGTILYALLGRNASFFQLLQQGVNPKEARSLACANGQSLFPAGSLVQSLKLSARTWKTWITDMIRFVVGPDGVVPDLLAILFRRQRGEGRITDRALLRVDLSDSHWRRHAFGPPARRRGKHGDPRPANYGERSHHHDQRYAVGTCAPRRNPVGHWHGCLQCRRLQTGAAGGAPSGRRGRGLGRRIGSGFIVFVFLAMFGLGVVWVLKYTREESVPSSTPVMVSRENRQIQEEVQRIR